MLMGDHAVVYGYPCLVTAVDLRASATIGKSKLQTISIETPALRRNKKSYSLGLADLENLRSYDRRTAFVVAAVKKIFSVFNIKQGLEVYTDGPINSYGLGSSSAITAATVFALTRLFDLDLDKRQIFEIAYSAVLDVQKVGSGYDVASAVYGGTLYYQSAKIIDPLQVASWPIVVGYSGQKVSTTSLVNHVRRLRGQYPEIIDTVFKTMGNLVNSATQYLTNGTWDHFGELMNINQGLLASLGVSTMNLDKPIQAALTSGAWGAKLSGAGGGDCMFAVVDDIHKKAVSDAISKSGAETLKIKVDVEGAKLE